MPDRTPDLFASEPPLPEGMQLVEEFISRAEEAALLADVARLELEHSRYKAYTARRRTASFGFSYDFDDYTLHPAGPIPGFLLPLREKVAAWTGEPADAFRHVLVTEYAPGTPLGWHRDVPQFELIVGISLNTACRMRFRPWPVRANAREGVLAVTLQPRSAYVLRGVARWGWQHSVPPTPGLRWSITLRTRRGGL
jgi:alkylated DNA repair dioxygenase AlkB